MQPVLEPFPRAAGTAAEPVVFVLWLMPLKYIYIDRAPTLMVAPADALSELFGFDVSDMSLGLVPR